MTLLDLITQQVLLLKFPLPLEIKDTSEITHKNIDKKSVLTLI